MLKIREPIRISLKNDLLSSQESFTERIRGNYIQMGSGIEETDLLHVVTQPPQLFLMNGGMTSMITSNNSTNNQIRKVNVINNLINRIMISADAGLSYQDNVFITNILHRLGIRDERKFMREVYKNTEEIKQRNEVLNLYWENLEEIRELVQEYAETNEFRVKNETEVLNANVLHLHEEVNRRLQTAAIYQILQNFYANTSDPRTVTGTEYRISEQERFAKEVLLTKLREAAREEVQPLVYRQENIYEGDDTESTEISVQSVTERISSAVLLDMISNIYENTFERLDHNIKNWLSTEDIYYGAAENTLYRIENNTAYLQYLHEESVKNEGDRENFSSEIDIINQLIAIWNSGDYRTSQSYGGNSYEAETVYVRNEGDEITERDGDTFESAQIELVNNEGDHNETNITTERKDELTEKVYQAYQQSIARNQRYMQNLQMILNRHAPEESNEKPEERMRRESRLALEHPEEFRQLYEEEEKKEAERKEEIRRESEKLLPPMQRVAHELIREYLAAPERFTHSERMSVNNMGLLLRDIYEARAEEIAESEGGEKAGSEGEEMAGEKAEILFPPVYREGEARREQEMIPGITEKYEPADGSVYETEVNTNIYPIYQSEFIFRNGQGTIEVITRSIIQRLVERSEIRPESRDVYESDSATIVHRKQETTVSEETIENLREEMKRIEDTRRTTSEFVQSNETNNSMVVNNVSNETVEVNTERIQSIVNSQVRAQIDTISDKVYGRIERQLKNEQRRRGL